MADRKWSRRRILQAAGLGAASVLGSGGCASPGGAGPGAGRQPPNLVIILTDDQGYADLGCYGARKIRTPNLDRMADQGVRFTDFYVAQAVCSASRAALLTGCYPNRIGILGALGPDSQIGIGEGEMTLAELLKQRGYATGIFGKWHLGSKGPFLPTRHGFDEYFGLPYSNDMWPRHPENPKAYPPLPLIENDRVVATDPDQSRLTGWYTERAVDFIWRNRNRPFFLYVPHNMPHVPLFVSEKFRGQSAGGLYGDVIEEIDWSVGQILNALNRHGLDERTLVIFTSDNGPWLSYGDHAGCALPLREGKGTAWEGGVRVPCIMRWSGQIPAGAVCSEPIMTIDIFPTVARLAEAPLPDHPIDGQDAWAVISRPGTARSPHDCLWFYWGRELHAVRSRRWKLHFPHPYRTLGGKPGGSGGTPVAYENTRTELALYDLVSDMGETTDLAAQRPQVVRQLEGYARQARMELGDSLTNIAGRGIRPPGQLPA